MSIPSSELTQERQAYLLNTHAVVQYTKRSGLLSDVLNAVATLPDHFSHKTTRRHDT